MDNNTSDITQCNIRDHYKLVLRVNELLAHSDPIGIVRGFIDMNEYEPEVPDFVDLILKDDISIERVEGIFKKWFCSCLPCDDRIMDLKINLKLIQKQWLESAGQDPK
jgi:hypothetical protein